MKSHIKVLRYQDRTDDWYAYRKNGIGSSEVGKVLGLSDWDNSSPIDIYYDKLNREDARRPDNAAMFWGRVLEDTVAEIWRYWDGTDDGYIANRNAGKVMRKNRRLNGIVVNEKYPWLYANLDRVIEANQFRLGSDELTLPHTPLEIKTISDREVKKWEAGIPPIYSAQVFLQMIVTESDYAEIALFDNYRNFYVYPIMYSKEFADQIIETTHDFWYNRVLPAREVLWNTDIVNPVESYELLPREVIEHEPPADNSEAYKDFFSRAVKAREEEVVIEGSDELLEEARKWKYLLEIAKYANKRVNIHRNKLVEAAKNVPADKIDFGVDGYFDWRWVSRFDKRVPYNRVKFPLDEKTVNDAIDFILKDVE